LSFAKAAGVVDSSNTSNNAWRIRIPSRVLELAFSVERRTSYAESCEDMTLRACL
jgi:hypothetical protein